MRILAVTTLRSEAPYIVEWVAHMRAIGVTGLLVYTNDCDDGTDALLAVLAKQGVLHHIVQQVPKGTCPQWQALKVAWKHPLRKSCDWAVTCDVDEFINVHMGEGSLHDLIAAVPDQTDAMRSRMLHRPIKQVWRIIKIALHIFSGNPKVASYTEMFYWPQRGVSYRITKPGTCFSFTKNCNTQNNTRKGAIFGKSRVLFSRYK